MFQSHTEDVEEEDDDDEPENIVDNPGKLSLSRDVTPLYIILIAKGWVMVFNATFNNILVIS